MKTNMKTGWMIALALGVFAGRSAGEVSDPAGILKKPIPDKLVVLTFDDGPVSHHDVVAPILKRHGFSGSFYICDFDCFRTRKDWYLTWRQMREMAADGLEIGNHTSGHAGGASIGYFLTMEDALMANGVPKPVTIAWPVYASNPATYPDLSTNGYTFGRGGYKRPYRPTVDNPFDIPGMEPRTVEDFVKTVRQAAGGRVVVLTYHGIPDIEHAAVSLDPAIFEAQMQYLKDNHYKVIAMRDLAEYIDPAKAAKLPPTPRDYKPTGTNRYTGPTVVKRGTLRIANAKSLGKAADVRIDPGAKLDLDFSGEVTVAMLTIEGKTQTSGKYSAANCPASLTGKGVIVLR